MNGEKRATWTRRIIIGLLVATAALDYFTFVINPQFWNFDMSALVVFTKSIWIITLVKFGVIAGLIYMLVKVKSVSDQFKFLWILVAVYLIFAQGVGALSNHQVAEANPPPEAAPSEEVRLKTGFNFAMLYAYYPILFAMLGFKLWEWGWRTR